jgi:hypothetical protein
MGFGAFRPIEYNLELAGQSEREVGVSMAIESKPAELSVGPIPLSCLGPDGKFRQETEEERKARMESARQRLREIAEFPNDPDDPPDEEWMRAIDELRPHRPVFKGSY